MRVKRVEGKTGITVVKMSIGYNKKILIV